MNNQKELFPHIDEITSVLLCAGKSMSALDIRRKLPFIEKTEINRTLYKNPEVFIEMPGCPPLWDFLPRNENDETDSEIHPEVWIDLLNCADILPTAEQYHYVEVRGYCNDLYEGKKPTGTLVVLPSEKGLLRMKIISDIALTLSQPGGKKKTIVLCSKDGLFENISDIFPQVVLCRTKEELKIQL